MLVCDLVGIEHGIFLWKNLFAPIALLARLMISTFYFLIYLFFYFVLSHGSGLKAFRYYHAEAVWHRRSFEWAHELLPRSHISSCTGWDSHGHGRRNTRADWWDKTNLSHDGLIPAHIPCQASVNQCYRLVLPLWRVFQPIQRDSVHFHLTRADSRLQSQP